MQVKLTSHFANNKVTLFDFQLAEHMNKQYTITQKWFTPYPFVDSKTWSSLKIFIACFFLFNFGLQIGTHWGIMYPSASQRGEKPQAGHYRPLMVLPFEFHTNGIQSAKEAELYATAYVDDFAFKRTMFDSRNMW